MKTTVRHSLGPSLVALSLSIAALLAGVDAHAGDRRGTADRFTEYADVIDVQPVYQDIRVREPRTECRIETQQRIVGYEQSHRDRDTYRAHRYEERHTAGGAIVGGVIGGVIGNQLGRGHSSGSRTGATIAGAIIGSAIGNEASADVIRHRRQPALRQHRVPVYETVEVERCSQVTDSRLERRIQHYDVTYRYRGRSFTTRMNRDPGRQIELQVSVAPARTR